MEFKEIKEWAIAHLEKQLEPQELSKSLAVDEILTKASYPVGTVRTWKGKKYIKIAPGRWQRKYDSSGRGLNQAINSLIRKMEQAQTPEDLYQLIMQNQSRFRDGEGRMLPEVQRLHDLVQKRQGEMEAGDSKKETPSQKTPKEGIDSIRAKYNSSKSVDGDEDEIYVGGETITGRWKLVEADAPSASHDERSFQKTKGFPTAKDGGTVNDRDYEHDKAAQEAVIDMAGDYDGRALSFDSPMVVTTDGVVISGNNRTMSSKIAARNGTDTKYIDALKKRAKKFGFTAEDVDGFKNPRVVFETDSKEEYSTEQFAKFNRSGKKAMDPIESAVKVSKTIKPRTIEDVAGQISEFDTLGELYADKKALRKVFNSFIDGGLIQKTDLPAYFTDSGITGAGKEFLETVMIGSVIDEGNIRQLNSEGTKSIRQKLVRAITPLIENKGMNGYSINKELNEAVRIAIQVAKNKEKFPNVEEFSKQQDMFEKLDPVAVELAKRMEGTQKEFASFMSSMNGGLRPSANGEVDIFLGEVESKEQIVNRMLGIKKSVQMIMAKSLSLLARVRIVLGGA